MTARTASPIERLEGRWTLQLLIRLAQGAQRFSDLRTAIPGVSANLLTVRLRALEDQGLVQRIHLPPPAARTVYGLGPGAAGLQLALMTLADWSLTEGLGLPNVRGRQTLDKDRSASRGEDP